MQELSREKSMIFLAGPRQAGKTTLAKIISKNFTNNLYFNWDIPQDKTRLVENPTFFQEIKRRLVENPTFFQEIKRRDPSIPLIIFDEIHKYKDWKNYLKGVYDQFHESYQFLVSGSGRLDIYQKGGDSLAGRYFLFHLWPFTMSELGRRNLTIDDFLANPLQISMENNEMLKEKWVRLSKLSGFPEPYLANRMAIYRRWSNTYAQQLIREDIRDLTGIKSVGDMETLYFLLPSKVGSPLSIPSLSTDLKVSYNSVRGWLAVFERFFLIFSIPPWTERVARAIQKERKVYLWDAPRIDDPAARFENMVAMELWRAVTSWNDLGYGQFSLHFIKNKEQQEVDFLIAHRHQPVVLIEAKISEPHPSSPLKKFQQALRIPAVQLIDKDEGYRMFSNNDQSILVAPAYQWLSQLP
jgi:predicted AAA+ superfamily ATPase